MKIYIVMGCQGEYSDRSEWPVVAYRKKARAEAEVKRLEARWVKNNPNPRYSSDRMTYFMNETELKS